MKRSLLNTVTAVLLSTGSMAGCDSVPEAPGARSLQVAPTTAALSHAAPSNPVVPVAGTPVLWGYVDGAGVAHFASTRVDGRYEQVLRETDGRRVLGKTQGTDGLLTWLEISPDVKALQPVLDEAAQATGVDEELLKAVITVESNYNPRAISPRGAVGLMQLTPVTADRYGTRQERQTPAARRLLDARTNIFTGARMLADLTRRYGGIDIALAAWNAGEGSVRKAGGQMPAIAETEAHVHLVLELYWALLQRKLPRHAHGVEVVSCAPQACGQ
ncbi:MAG: lytic transglycosylase domain-containing protein [Vitreoscilla sp.]